MSEFDQEYFPHKESQELLRSYKTIWALNHATSLLSWDQETYMPEDGVFERSIALSEIATLIQRLITDKSFLEKIEALEKIEDPTIYERALIRVLRRSLKYYLKVPPEIIAEFSKTASEANVVWRNARKENNFEKFKPYLDKLVSLNIKIADYLGYEKNPYDALLDLYEEGLTADEFKRIIDKLVPGLKKILDKILSDGYFSRPCPLENMSYDVNVMRKVNEKILEIFGYDRRRLRLDVSAHPFTTNMGIRDVRITTRYEGIDFRRTMFSVIHEFGHALYELQIDERLSFTPLASGASMGIHESQSRFWENIIGRSREFIYAIYDLLADNLDLRGKYDVEEIYRYFNIVRPGLIRVDADEVTYNFHIVLRFELENMMINQEIKTEDLPELWNDYMEKLLGIRPKTYSEGVLQDIHWSSGSIGYFPSYSLGTLIAAHIRDKMSKEIDLADNVRNLRFEPVKKWLREKIHMYGSIYPPRELLKRSLDIEVDPTVFLRYLEEKFLIK
jgi:carboxypeptidase Taq